MPRVSSKARWEPAASPPLVDGILQQQKQLIDGIIQQQKLDELLAKSTTLMPRLSSKARREDFYRPPPGLCPCRRSRQLSQSGCARGLRALLASVQGLGGASGSSSSSSGSAK